MLLDIETLMYGEEFGFEKAHKKVYLVVGPILLAVGIWLMISSGFTLLKLLFLLWMLASMGMHSGVVAAGILIVNFTSLLQLLSGMGTLVIYSAYGWIAVTLISIAFVLLTGYAYIENSNSRTIDSQYYFWLCVCLGYAALLLYGILLQATGINLKRIMKAQGVTAKDVREYLGLCGVQSIYHWLNGSNLPSVDNLYALSALFQLPIDELLCGNKLFTS